MNHPGQVYGLAGSADSVKAAADVSDVRFPQKAALKKMFGSPIEGAKVATRLANVPMTKSGDALDLDVPLGTAAHEVAAVHAEYAALHERELPDAPPYGDAQQHDRHVLERAAHTSCEYAHAVAGLRLTTMAAP